MNWLDKLRSKFGMIVDKVQDLRDRIRGRVQDAAELAELAGLAAIRIGDKLAGLSPRDIAWLTGPVAAAVVAAQQSSLITAAVGSERLRAVELALRAADAGLHWADRSFDARWAQAKPFIEELIQIAKDRRVYGFEHKIDAELAE
jgi:hypothetical protein